MKEFTLYRPYESNKWAALFPLCLGIFCIIFDAIFSMLFLTWFAVILFLFTLLLYLDYSLVIGFGQNEIQVFDSKIRKEYLWSDFSHIYYGRNFKAFQYLILSSKPLDEKTVRALCNKCSLSLKNISLDGILVIPVDEKKKPELENLIKERTPHIQLSNSKSQNYGNKVIK